MKRFLLNAIILTATSFALQMMGVSFSVYISAKIGPEGMGVFQLLTSVYMFAITLAISGIGLSTTRLVAEELATGSEGGVRRAMSICLRYSLMFSLTAAAIMFFCADIISQSWLYGKVSVRTVRVLCLSLPFMSVCSVYSGYFVAVRRVHKSAFAQLFEQTVKIGISVYALNFFMPKGADYACLALVLGSTLSEFASCILLFVLHRMDIRRYRKQQSDNPPMKKLLSIALPVALSSYIRSGLNTYKQVIIPASLSKSGISGDTAIAQYGIIRGMAFPVLMFPSALLSAFSQLLIPEVAENHITDRMDRIHFIIARIFKITLLFSICVSGVLFVYSDELAQMIYKSADSAIYIKVFAPLIPIMYFDGIVDSILKGMNQQVSVVGINIVETVVSIALIYVLLPLYGVTGYVIVIFAGEILNGGLSIHRLFRHTNFQFKFFEYLGHPLLAMAATLGIVRLLNPGGTVISICVAAGLYLALLFVTGGIRYKELFRS